MTPPPAAGVERRHLRAPSHRLAMSLDLDRMVSIPRLDPTTAEVVGQILGAQTNYPVQVAASLLPTSSFRQTTWLEASLTKRDPSEPSKAPQFEVSLAEESATATNLHAAEPVLARVVEAGAAKIAA
jgi:hypothetical protein